MNFKKQFMTVTTLSKTLAGLIFISMPFIGFYFGTQFQKTIDYPVLNIGIEGINKPSDSVANPASVNCTKVGGSLVIKNKPDGSQYGLCFFDDARACEEWAMMRGDCPVGGMKTTGYDTEAQKYCAWSGGQTFAVPNAKCTFKDGSICPDEEFYSGVCLKGKN
jgi:putative hemolysin